MGRQQYRMLPDRRAGRLAGEYLLGLGWADWSETNRTIFTLCTMTGFCGGFSTFSAFTLDCVKYFERGQIEIWVVFGTMTVFVGLFGCALGYWLGRHI